MAFIVILWYNKEKDSDRNMNDKDFDKILKYAKNQKQELEKQKQESEK